MAIPITRPRAAAWARSLRCVDGSEELHDHRSDPHEWHNLAADQEHDGVLAEHRRRFPEREAEPVPDLIRERATRRNGR